MALPRQSLAALRSALMRDLGGGYATYLQEAGYAGGDAISLFNQSDVGIAWLRGGRIVRAMLDPDDALAGWKDDDGVHLGPAVPPGATKVFEVAAARDPKAVDELAGRLQQKGNPGLARTLRQQLMVAAPDYAISPPGDAHRLFVVEQNGLLRMKISPTTATALNFRCPCATAAPSAFDSAQTMAEPEAFSTLQPT